MTQHIQMFRCVRQRQVLHSNCPISVIKNKIAPMDSNKLYRTGHTIDETYLESTSPPFLDQSVRSRPSFNQSRTLHVGAPMTPTAQQRNFFPVNRAPRAQDDMVIYCPVCRREFLNSQIQYHANMHDSASSYGFRTEDVSKSLQRTQASLSRKTSEPAAFQYPMVQPMEFWTKELNDSAKNDVFKYVKNVNYDNVDRRLFHKPITSTAECQTNRKPPLQYESNNTNLYNCLDNAVNSRLGPKFTFADIVGHNQIVTPKRNLEQWEQFQQFDYNRNQILKARPISNFR